MPDQPIALTVGGQTYRVLTDTCPETLQQLATLVDDRLRACNPTGRLTQTQALLYAALALADDLQTERQLRKSLQAKTRSTLRRVLQRIDHTLPPTPTRPSKEL